MDITFHIGAPRTGSSSIQKALELKFKHSHEVYFERTRRKQSALANYLSYFHHYPNSKLLAHFLSGYAELLTTARRRKGAKALILSEENIAGNMLGKSNKLFKNSDFFFTFVKRLNRKHSCQTVAVIRKMDEYVESCYKFQLQRNERRTIQEFIDDLDVSHLRWSKLLDSAKANGLIDALFLVEFDSYFKNSTQFDYTQLPSGFDSSLQLDHANSSAKHPMLLSFMRVAHRKNHQSIYRSADLQQEIDASPNPDVEQLIINKFGDQPWVRECLKETSKKVHDGDFTDVCMSEEQREFIRNLVKQDTLELKNSSRCFGSFQHW